MTAHEILYGMLEDICTHGEWLEHERDCCSSECKYCLINKALGVRDKQVKEQFLVHGLGNCLIGCPFCKG
jgi:hypothetical protein